ncbi:MAG: T9SS type A sorting domain-containing protein [Ignavibacteriaceae bacterium]|nr:T9SS type A sorting domain-containing protein [Ignavibacteriaceae bacterium]
MKSFILTFIFLCITVSGQNASDYFPQNTGHVWYFKTALLDSVNNPIDETTVYVIDSFANTGTYQGQNSNFILTKTGAFETVNFQPFLDTNFVSFAGTEAKTYFRANGLSALIDDSTFAGIGIIELLASLENWYPTYKFASAVNANYLLLRKDTTITVDSITLPVRFEIRGRRLNDGSFSNETGTYNCKKFMITFSVSYLVIINPLPPIPVQILAINDTQYVAQNNWVVKTYAPSSTIDLSILNLGVFTIPGLSREIIPPIPVTSVETENPDFSIKNFILYPNYPNPVYLANGSSKPETNIVFQLKELSDIRINIYDLRGEMLKTMVFNNLAEGIHSIPVVIEKEFSSGTYVYTVMSNEKLLSGKFQVVK